MSDRPTRRAAHISARRNLAAGTAGFGTQGTPGGIVRTEWNTSRIWLRQSFELPQRPLENPMLWLAYDEDPEIYLNGILAARLTGWTTTYDYAEIDPEAQARLKPGRNLMAVRASQTYGGQYIDVGIIEQPGSSTGKN